MKYKKQIQLIAAIVTLIDTNDHRDQKWYQKGGKQWQPFTPLFRFCLIDLCLIHSYKLLFSFLHFFPDERSVCTLTPFSSQTADNTADSGNLSIPVLSWMHWYPDHLS